MRLSKIYRVQDEPMQMLHFASFDGDGGSTAPAYQSSHQFRPVDLPVKGAEPTAAAAVPIETMAPAAAVAAAVSETDRQAQFDEARQQGYDEGFQAGQAKLDQTARALGEALTEIARLRETLLQNSREDMLRLSVAIAEQLLQQQLKTDPAAILPVVERALKAAVRSDSYQVRVHPDDLAVLNDNKPLFLSSLSGVKKLTFEADEALTPGGCQIRSELGDVDASLETQLDEIRNALAEAMVEG